MYSEYSTRNLTWFDIILKKTGVLLLIQLACSAGISFIFSGWFSGIHFWTLTCGIFILSWWKPIHVLVRTRDNYETTILTTETLRWWLCISILAGITVSALGFGVTNYPMLSIFVALLAIVMFRVIRGKL